MNTPVNFEIVELLMDKGFENNLVHDGMGSYHYNVSIADAVMWLHEKHGLWIYTHRIEPFVYDDIPYPKSVWVSKCDEKFIDTDNGLAVNHYNSPTEAYLAAIEWTLNNLVN